MAKQKEAPEKRGGILGFFDSIKEFFQNLFEKIRIALEFNKRVDEGKKNWENSPEGKAQREAQEKDQEFGFRSREEMQQEQVHFPGYDEMKIQESGLIRIPPKVELLWKNATVEDAATRYVTAINDKFAERPNPVTSQNGQAFAEIAQDMRIATQRGDTGLHQYVLGNTHITAQSDGEKVNITLSDGTTTKNLSLGKSDNMAEALTSAYTEISGKGEPVVYIDPKNNTKSVCMPGENGYETYTAHTVTGWQGIGDNRSRYEMPNIVQITGPRPDQQLANAMIASQSGPAQESDIREVAFRACKQAKNDGQSSIFIVGDKMLWASNQDGKITLNVTAHRSPYEIAPYQVTLGEKQYNAETGDLKKSGVFYVTQKAFTKIDERIATAKTLEAQKLEAEAQLRAAGIMQKKLDDARSDPAKQSELERQIVDFAKLDRQLQTADMESLRLSTIDSYGQTQPNGYPASIAVCQSEGHTLTFSSYTRQNEHGETVVDSKIHLDGECLYHADTARAEDGSITMVQNGKFENSADAMSFIQSQVPNATWNRQHMNMDASLLGAIGEEARKELPDWAQKLLGDAESFAPEAGDMFGEHDLD